MELGSGNWMVCLSRGECGRDTLLVRGNLARWLEDAKAKPTKDDNRFVIRGWRAIVIPVSDDALSKAEAILGLSYVSRDDDL